MAPSVRAFFLDGGKYTGSTGFAFADRHSPIGSSGVARKTPTASVIFAHDQDDTALQIPLRSRP